ncbi:hypothetical protein MTO96_003041 [Rhipicephalus appendiculatus]
MSTFARFSCAAFFLAAVSPFAALPTVRSRPDRPRLRLLLDVDTGVDDTMAITLATRLPNVYLEAVTVVAGNGNLSIGYDNTLRTLNAIDRTDSIFFKAPTNDSLILKIGSHLCSYTRVGVGNRHRYDGKGNVSPTAEFNFFTDPEAALVVLQRATCPVTLIPWEAALQATVPWDTYYSVTKKSGRLQKFLRDITTHTVRCCLSGGQSPGGFSVGDFLAVLAAAVPESVSSTLEQRVDVERCGEYARGQLVHAWESKILPEVKRNVTIVESFDVDVVEKYFKYAFESTEA